MYGLPDTLISRLQRVQNRAARIVLGIHLSDKINSNLMLRNLHWLPIRARIDYKIALLCYNAIDSRSPNYIQDLIVPYSPSRLLRSNF